MPTAGAATSAALPVWDAKRWDDDDDDEIDPNKRRPRDPNAPPPATSRAARLGGERFYAVATAQQLVEMVAAFLRVPIALGGACGPEALHRIVDLLSVFNSRSCQLVLGAGAMQSAAKLKTITAKHLAATSQALGLLVACLPAMRAALTPHLPGKHATLINQLDMVAKDFEDHRQEIFSKLVSILSDLIDKAASKLLQTISVASRSNLDSLHESVFEVDQGLVKLLESTRLLHKALSGLLPAAERNAVFAAIAAKCSGLFAQYLSKAEALPRDGQPQAHLIKKKMLTVNVKYLVTEMRRLDGAAPTACAELERFLA